MSDGVPASDFQRPAIRAMSNLGACSWSATRLSQNRIWVGLGLTEAWLCYVLGSAVLTWLR